MQRDVLRDLEVEHEAASLTVFGDVSQARVEMLMHRLPRHVLARDLHLVVGPVLASTLLLLFGNLVADLLLLALDPRIREAA